LKKIMRVLGTAAMTVACTLGWISSTAAEESIVFDDPEVYSLITTYYEAICSGDVDTLRTLTDGDEVDFETITEGAYYSEAYEYISTYSIPGPDEGSYVIFACNDLRLKDIDTLAAGMSVFYAVTVDGQLQLAAGDWPYEYIAEQQSRDEIQTLISTTEYWYSYAKATDPELAAFAESLIDEQDDETGSVDEEAIENANESVGESFGE